MTIISIDAASITGWAVWPAKVSGIKDLTPTKNQKPGARYQKLWNLLSRLSAEHGDIDQVVYEEPIPHHSSMTAAEYAWGYVATIKLWCATNNVSVRGVHVAAWKKFITGNGHAEKKDVLSAIRNLGFYPIDHNESDALAILCWATQSFAKNGDRLL